VSGFVKPWLKPVPWSSVVSINARLCQAGRAMHKPTSEGYEPTRALWEESRSKEMSLRELLQLCFCCHRLAPFCFYNGNTFVTIVKTLLPDPVGRIPTDQAYILRSIAGHIVAGTVTDVENKQFDRIIREFES
jgi:hypothetical protein